MFSFYSASDGKVNSMTTRGFFALVSKHNIICDKLTAAECARVFELANLEASFDEDVVDDTGKPALQRKQTLDDKILDLINDDNALMRFEFFRALVILGHRKFIKFADVPAAADAAEALDLLIGEHLLKFGNPASRCDQNVFRQRRLYTRDCHDILEKHLPVLRQFFKVYSKVEYFDEVLNDVYEARPHPLSGSGCAREQRVHVRRERVSPTLLCSAPAS